MSKIMVPKPQKGAFNKERPASELLKSQVKHLHALEEGLPHRLQTRRNVEEIRTEADASNYINTIMKRLHPRGTIKVPRPGPGSFHKHRRVSDLLKRQIEHFREAEKHLPADQHSGIDINSIRLEHEAAAYIGKVTAALHGQAGVVQDRGAKEQPSSEPPNLKTKSVEAASKPGGSKRSLHTTKSASKSKKGKK